MPRLRQPDLTPHRDMIEKLNEISVKLDRLLAMHNTQELNDSPTAIYFGSGQFQIGAEKFTLTGSQRIRVWEALLDLGGSGTTKQIENQCSQDRCPLDGAGKIIRGLKAKKFRDGKALLEPYILLPGGGRKGGYYTTIMDKREVKK